MVLQHARIAVCMVRLSGNAGELPQGQPENTAPQRVGKSGQSNRVQRLINKTILSEWYLNGHVLFFHNILVDREFWDHNL